MLSLARLMPRLISDQSAGHRLYEVSFGLGPHFHCR